METLTWGSQQTANRWATVTGARPLPEDAKQGPLVLAIFVITQLLDGALTYWGVTRFGIELEMNSLLAMSMHFVVADQGLREQFYPAYDASGRWILAAAPILGWVMGVFVNIPPAAISTLFAFLAGAIVLNVLKHELPEERHSHFFAFALGAGLYAAMLLATE